MVKFRIDGVELAWRDNGYTMWHVLYTRMKDSTQWTLRTWGIDELDAYKKALEMLEGAST